MTDLEYRIKARTARGYRTEITAGIHTLFADEPIAAGGTDQGPNPYDLLVSALGACTAMTVRMYADRKGWPLDEVIVRLQHGRNHAKDEERCEDSPVRLDLIQLHVDLQGELTDEQRTRLLEIAQRCPVHRTLDAGVRMVSI